VDSTSVPLGQCSAQGQKWTSQSDSNHILPDIGALRDARDRRKVMVPTDNAKPHVAKRVKQCLHENGLRSAHIHFNPWTQRRAAFSLRPCKRMLQGTKFQMVEELLGTVVQILSDISLEKLVATFHQWMARFQARIVG
jgi:hypothetical protein